MRWFCFAVLVLTACQKESPVTDISVMQAAKQLDAKGATPVDANTPEYRAVAGWVPGAILLGDYNDYPLTELPADKARPLIFYCTSKS
jgi:rhodanese-related sulfurtransferase